MKNISRRNFIQSGSKAGLAIALATSSAAVLSSCSSSKGAGGRLFKTGFDQQPLPWKYDALENAIDALTMEIHYSKHAAAYSKNLKEAVAAEAVDSKTTLENILRNISKYSTKMRNNGGGHFNHELFWKCLTPQATLPGSKLADAITKNFGSYDAFKTQFTDTAKTRFGSGWAWLYADADKNLKIGSTPNQDNPLMNISDIKGTPLLALDVWEHAYYLRYQNKRADYIDNFWKVVNWNFVSEQFNLL